MEHAQLSGYFLKKEYDLFMSAMNSLQSEQRSSLVNEYIQPGHTFLSKACERRNLTIVKYLVETCRADVEMLVNFVEEWDAITFFTKADGKPLFDFKAPILWHLARHFSQDTYEPILKYLIVSGANVNSRQESHLNSTPLMVACSKNKLSLVKYLIEEANANVNEVDINGENCLFYAVRHNEDSYDLVNYLIQCQVNLNKINRYGKNALNYSVELKTPDVTGLLIDHHINLLNDMSMHSAMIIVASNGDVYKFNMLYNLIENNVELKIMALEIIGAVLSEKKTQHEACVIYWELSLQERNYKKHPLRHMDGFVNEFATQRDLKQLGRDNLDLFMQSLWIKERALIKFNVISRLCAVNLCECVFKQDMLKSTTFADFICVNYERLETLWWCLLGLQSKYLTPLDEQLVQNIVDFGNFLNCCKSNGIFRPRTAVKLTKLCLHELNRTILAINKVNSSLICLRHLFRSSSFSFSLRSISFDDLYELNDAKLKRKDVPYYHNFEYKNRNLVECSLNTLLKVFVYLLRLIAPHIGHLTQAQLDELKIITKNFIYFSEHLDIRADGILTLSIRPCILQFDPNYRYRFRSIDPVSYECVEFLLQCGANPNAPLKNNSSGRKLKNTCLNTGLFSKELKCSNMRKRLILLFLKHGAHMDNANENGLSLVQMYQRSFGVSLGSLVNPMKHVSLKCLCAKVILDRKLAYESILPSELIEFVNAH